MSSTAKTIPAIAAARRLRQNRAVRTGVPVVMSPQCSGSTGTATICSATAQCSWPIAGDVPDQDHAVSGSGGQEAATSRDGDHRRAAWAFCQSSVTIAQRALNDAHFSASARSGSKNCLSAVRWRDILIRW